MIIGYKFNDDSVVDVTEGEFQFYNDLTPHEAKYWINKQETQSAAIYVLKTPVNPITEQIPSFYILCSRDNAPSEGYPGRVRDASGGESGKYLNDRLGPCTTSIASYGVGRFAEDNNREDHTDK